MRSMRNDCEMFRTSLLIVLICPALLSASPTTKPATRPFSETLATMPADTIPEAGGWDEFSTPKAQKWLRDNVTGERLISFPLEKATVQRIAAPNDPLDTSAWRVNLSLKAVAVTIGRQRVYVALKMKGKELPSMTTTEAVAKTSKRWVEGDLVTIKSSIISADIGEPITWKEPDREGNTVVKKAPCIVIISDKIDVQLVGKWRAAKP